MSDVLPLYVWVEVGCLECGHPTVYRGAYTTLEAAEQAIEDEWQAYKAQRLAEFGIEIRDSDRDATKVVRVDDPEDSGGWHGQGVNAVIVVEASTVHGLTP